jgi:GTP cyclohydrolase I
LPICQGAPRGRNFKLARLVDAYDAPSDQEKMTAEIASCLDKVPKSPGVAVIEAVHHCTA